MRQPGAGISAILLAAAAAAGSCSAEAPPAGAGASTAQTVAPERAPPSLYGRWRILEVNGTSARSHAQNGEPPSVAFTAGGYGGHSGCNNYGGHGLAFGDRWFAEPPMANQQGCADLEAQESTIFDILSGGPVVAWSGPDTAELRTPGRRLRIQRTGPAAEPSRPNAPAMLLAGTRWELQAVDGAPVRPTRAAAPVRLTFEADAWALDTSCGRRTGTWRQSDGAVVLQAEPAVAKACPADPTGAVDALSRMLRGELRYVVGPNGEFVLADAEGWATGQRDQALGMEGPDLLSGRWRITSVDGGPPSAAGERAAELAFGPGSFAVWDGCRHSEGVAVVRARQLFTQGSGMITQAACPEDPVRNRINAVVAASPRIARTAGGDLALVSRAGALGLQRISSTPVGVGVQTRLRSGMAFDIPSGTGRTARLTLGPGDRFTLALSCTTLKGRWRSDRAPWGSYARFGPDGPPPDCADGPEEEPLYGFFMGDVQTAIGPNRDIALFVSNGESRPARVAAP